jgi:two-component system, OmpR family, response regulator
MRKKWVYTTGEAADICKLSQQTIIRCFDNGQLQGFRVPGSRFRRIPRDKLIQFMKEHSIPMDGLESDKIRVLVVDDDPQIVDILVEFLRQDGRFEVRTAQTGYDAGVLTQQFQPDVVVLDYLLPDINGNVVCRTIRENQELASIKILIISGAANQVEVDKLLEAGADDFIKKPFNIEKVVERILSLAKS